ncbi:MAG TPA: ATP-binding protein [Blastocatellia bacterium]|jgi:PAS domain S-box-containing protein
MKKFRNTKLVLFFAVLTVALTWVVILTYGTFLRRPFYAWVEARWPGRTGLQDQIQQSVEHFFISTVVDVIVVTLLLRLVNRQQRKLRDSEERYRALFEHASDGIGVVRASDHLLIDVNKKFEEVLGHDQMSLIGGHVCELFEKRGGEPGHESSSEHSVCYMSSDKNSDANEWPEGSEITIRTQAGAARVISLSRSAISTGNERLFILIIRDLTERKRLEREKQEMERQLFQTSKLASIGELSAGVAHEINNPLNGMINFAQLLKDDGVARNDSERQMLDGIIDEGERIARIVRNLLTFARQDPHLPTEVAIAQVIKNSVTLFEHQLDKDRIEVEMDVAQDTLPVRADASRLRQVFVNVISNAHHALKAKDSDVKLLRIIARNVERGGSRLVRIEFFDNGVGIAPEHIDKVFDPFFTTRRDSGGTGLGLSLSFGIIHDYGGNVTAESEEGSFTRFIIELPADASRENEYEKSVVGGRRA